MTLAKSIRYVGCLHQKRANVVARMSEGSRNDGVFPFFLPTRWTKIQEPFDAVETSVGVSLSPSRYSSYDARDVSRLQRLNLKKGSHNGGKGKEVGIDAHWERQADEKKI